jgi:PhzF family phenazine biosynthesis protein
MMQNAPIQHKRPYKVVDVFTARPLLGNPVAVIMAAEGLDNQQMQAIANWTNLSETTFILPPKTTAADYRLRIFTPRSELRFAGHPTLGSAHALLESGYVPKRADGKLVQECAVGLVEVAIEAEASGQKLSFSLPAAKMIDLSAVTVAKLTEIIGRPIDLNAPPAVVDVGAIWMVVSLEDAEAVKAVQPDFAKLAKLELQLGVTGLIIFGKHRHGEAAIEIRAFAPSCGVNEDPVCGSGNGCAAVFQWQRGLLAAEGQSYLATQGGAVGRDGRISVSVDRNGNVEIGGSCVTCVEGSVVI